jgi:signal transduction histidine kinase
LTPPLEDADSLAISEVGAETGEWSADATKISRRAADILDSLNDAVSAYDGEWRWIYLNPAAKALLTALGKDPEAMLGRVLWEELPTLLGTQFETESRRAASDRVVAEYEEYLPQLGQWFETRIVPSRGLIITHMRNITERQRAERAIEVGADRAARLLTLATRLGAASTPDEVAGIALSEALAATGAQSGSVAWLRYDPVSGPMFETVKALGYRENLSKRFSRFPLKGGRPLSDAIITRAPVLIESREAWLARYAEIIQPSELPGEAMANIPVMVEGEAVAGISISFREPRKFDDATRTFLATIGEQTGIALGRARAFERDHRARDASAFLAEASRLLSSSLDYATTLMTLAQACVPRLGDWCAVDVVTNPEATDWPPPIARLAMVHQDPAKVALAEELERRYPPDWSQPTGIVATIRNRTVTFVPSITDEMLAASTPDPERLALLRRFGFSACIIVPLVARDKTLGALTLIMSESGRAYEQADLDLALELAQRAALAIDHARLFRAAEAARAEAEKANAAKSEFLATMSHELRTPLNAIGGYAELLEMGLHGALTEQQLDAVNRIKRAHQSLLGLVEDVLSFARIESGRLEYSFTDVPLDQVLSTLEAFISPQLGKRGLAYEYWPVDPTVTVWADREKLEQIVLNLLTNALKFTDRGTVSLSAAAHENHVAIHVRDTGVGIPGDKLEAIFEPFVQLEAGLTRRAQGSGLGLAISRDIARAMKGEVTVESVVGEGSLFTVRLPRRPA